MVDQPTTVCTAHLADYCGNSEGQKTAQNFSTYTREYTVNDLHSAKV